MKDEEEVVRISEWLVGKLLAAAAGGGGGPLPQAVPSQLPVKPSRSRGEDVRLKALRRE